MPEHGQLLARIGYEVEKYPRALKCSQAQPPTRAKHLGMLRTPTSNASPERAQKWLRNCTTLVVKRAVSDSGFLRACRSRRDDEARTQIPSHCAKSTAHPHFRKSRVVRGIGQYAQPHRTTVRTNLRSLLKRLKRQKRLSAGVALKKIYYSTL